MLLGAVYELSTVEPAEPEGRKYDATEWRFYSEGYYFALARSLKVMDLAVNRFAMYRRTRQAESRRRNKEPEK